MAEMPLERTVSHYIRQLPYLWVRVEDEPGPKSQRVFLERNSIALLSNFNKCALDCASSHWLGRSSDKVKVRESGLWNSNHVDGECDLTFLSLLDEQIMAMG